MSASIASTKAADLRAALAGLSPNAVCALPYLFEVWALPHQQVPKGDWSTWVILGGRGAGKTRAGAEWVRAQVEGAGPKDKGKCKRVAIIGETIDQAREVMVFGESGIIACSPPDRKPKWNGSRKTLTWPNGAEAQVLSASSPEDLRGPQFDAAWLDELAKWSKARESWDMLQFTLRLGSTPRAIVTTTPRNQEVLKAVLAKSDTVVTHAPTQANKVNLAPGFLKKIKADYGGTRLGRQEINGELLTETQGSLWPQSIFDNLSDVDDIRLDRVVVAVDPPASSKATSDECGIIVAGVEMEGSPENWRAVVLADLSLSKASPNAWAKIATKAYETFQADRVVAEINQGGEMVEAILRQYAPLIPFKGVHATRGKVVRAEPVSALYEQGRVVHKARFEALEEQMSRMSLRGFEGQGSPDRVDALVWALSDLIVVPASKYRRPSIRMI